MEDRLIGRSLSFETHGIIKSMETKCCTKCKEDLPVSCFNKKKDNLQTFCIECNKKYLRQHYLDNKASYIAKARTNTRKYKNQYQDYKAQLQCQRCSEDSPSCLDFHHVDPDQKDYAISKAIRTKTLKAIQEELNKCAVLCSNCHRKYHAGELGDWQPDIGESFNGRTNGFDPLNEGSTPSSPTTLGEIDEVANRSS